MARTSVLVADAQRLFVDALCHALDEYPELRVAEPRPTRGEEAVQAALKCKPDVALIDYWIRGMNGPATSRAIRRWLPDVTVVFLAGFHVGPCQLSEAHAAGGVGFIKKGATVEHVVHVIGTASEWVPNTPTACCKHHHSHEVEQRLGRLLTLTAREIEILQMMSLGLPAKELARRLSISVGTLKNHLHKVLSKLQVKSQHEAVKMAQEEGMIFATGYPEVSSALPDDLPF